MLGYEWGNHSPPQPPPPPQLIITDDHDLHLHHHHHDPSSHHHHRPIFDDPYSTPCTFPHTNTPLPPSSLFNLHSNTPPPHFPLYDTDPRAFPCASSSPSYPSLFQVPQPLASESTLQSPGYPVLVPKPEPDFQNRIGLNLGGRTYFASDDDLVSRLYRRSRGGDQPVNTPKCQAEGCHADLSHAKHYHRRHKVCEFHSKAATVVAAGLTQRFCQQCSRFHVLSEFDNGKRSCRKRLADHNRRRRKSHHHQQQQQQQQQAANRDQREPLSHSYPDIPPKSPSQSIQRSTSDSGANSSSSVTVAISSPLASFDSNFRQRSYE